MLSMPRLHCTEQMAAMKMQQNARELHMIHVDVNLKQCVCCRRSSWRWGGSIGWWTGWMWCLRCPPLTATSTWTTPNGSWSAAFVLINQFTINAIRLGKVLFSAASKEGLHVLYSFSGCVLFEGSKHADMLMIYGVVLSACVIFSHACT